MNNVVSTFPLLRLPKKAMLITLRTMRYPQIFGISLLSKKSKSLMESLKLKTMTYLVDVECYLFIMLFFQNYESICIEVGRVQDNDPIQDLDTPGNFYIGGEHPWTYSLSARQLIDHLKFIFHSPITNLLLRETAERFNAESIHRNVKDIERISLVSGYHVQNKRVLSVIKPSSLTLEARALVNGCVPREILIQNFDVVQVPNVHITLDELLMTNAQGIDMSCCQLSAKTINNFLKLWTKGSNPRLEWMNLRFSGDSQNEKLLIGLKCKDVPHNTERYFKSPSHKEPTKVYGRWDIWRLDGTQATIAVSKTFNLYNFKFYVWHDHCIIN